MIAWRIAAWALLLTGAACLIASAVTLDYTYLAAAAACLVWSLVVAAFAIRTIDPTTT